MVITNSPDITQLIVKITWDLSGISPICTLENLSTGDHLNNIDWAFVTTSPSGTPIHEGNINDPDVEGVWTTHTLSDAWPKPMNQIEWSGAPYQFYVIAKDSNGVVFTGTPQLASICRPIGNLPTSKNTFGIATSDVKVKCSEARVFFQDTTYHNYKGLEGDQISSVLRVVYPIDETLTIPDPFVASAYSTALVPISYSSSNYQFVQSTVYDYDMGENTIIRIKYQTIKTFAVWCNIDLGELQCEINKLIDEVETGNCSDVVAAQKKLNIVISKFSLVIIGILQPLTGIDVPVLLEEIKAVGGFNCNCCTAPTGIIPTTAAIIDGYSFSVNKLGGDVNGTFTTNGTNITLNIGDVKYIVTMTQQSPSNVTAFSFVPTLSSDGFTKTYALSVDGQQLGLDVLNNIATDPQSLNLLNSLITAGSSNFQLVVDGGCIFNTTASCDYDFTLTGIPASTTFALLTSIKVGNVSHPLSFSFNLTNLGALQSYLNTLGYGTFIVTSLGSGNVLISSDDNTNELVAVTYKTGSINYIADLSRNCTGYVPISANVVVQNMIDYLCGITDADMITSDDYEICYVNPDTKQKETVIVNGGSTVAAFITELTARGCDTIDYIISLSTLNCANIKNIFLPNASSLMGANDVILGTKQGACSSLGPIELGTRMLQLGAYNAAFLEQFCFLVDLCRNGLACTPYSVFTVAVAYSSPASDLQQLVVTFVNTATTSSVCNIYRVTNGIKSSSAASTTILLPGDSPFTSPDLPEGQYSVELTPEFADGKNCPASIILTDNCYPITSFQAYTGGESGYEHFNIKYTTVAPKVKLIVGLPNGGTQSFIYTNDGSTIHINFTEFGSQYGDYTFTIYPVCNVTTNYIGVASAPIVIEVAPPNNSSFINNSAGAMTNVLLTSFATVISSVFNSSSVASSGGTTGYYLANGFYNSLVININTGTIATGSLVTGTGTFAGVVSGGGSVITFSNVTILSGCTITLT